MAQRQDSMIDQLRSLIPFANFHGMYDAADFIQKVVAGVDARCRECGGALREEDRRMVAVLPAPEPEHSDGGWR